MYNIIKYQPSEYGSYRFPAWAEILGILMGVLSCLMIPVGMVVAVLREEGTLWEVGCSGAQNCWGEPQKCAGVTTSPCQACISWKFLHSLSWKCVSPSLLAAHGVWEMTYPRAFQLCPLPGCQVGTKSGTSSHQNTLNVACLVGKYIVPSVGGQGHVGLCTHFAGAMTEGRRQLLGCAGSTGRI